ncbi:MAG: ParA family protein, partial [Rhodospirillales bacterium]|nr:ParA family protein [Rhodospirillales bacterium]
MEDARNEVPTDTTATDGKPSPARPLIIAVCNQKGGSAKTTTAVNIATCLGALGCRVIVFDLDAQGNATRSFGVHPLPDVGAYDALCGDAPLVEVCLPTACDRVALAPATPRLAFANLDLKAAEHSREIFLSLLEPLTGEVDVVVIDCPPTLGAMTVTAIAAADSLLVPVTADPFAMDGLDRSWTLMRRLGTTQEAASGILLIGEDASPLSVDLVKRIRRQYGAAVYAATVPADLQVVQSNAASQPVCLYDPECPAAAAYLTLSREWMQRMRRASLGSLPVP